SFPRRRESSLAAGLIRPGVCALRPEPRIMTELNPSLVSDLLLEASLRPPIVNFAINGNRDYRFSNLAFFVIWTRLRGLNYPVPSPSADCADVCYCYAQFWCCRS